MFGEQNQSSTSIMQEKFPNVLAYMQYIESARCWRNLTDLIFMHVSNGSIFTILPLQELKYVLFEVKC